LAAWRRRRAAGCLAAGPDGRIDRDLPWCGGAALAALALAAPALAAAGAAAPPDTPAASSG
jgi:hypothetical protein